MIGAGMPPFIQFLVKRFLSIPISLVLITMVLYGGAMLTPPEARAELYMPAPGHQTEEQRKHMVQLTIVKYHLRDPFPIQYAIWVKTLLYGSWGYSPVLHEDVLPALLRRTPATAELALYSLVLFIPLGLLAGVIAGWHQRKAIDEAFRVSAFMATSFPPFILAIILIAVFYVSLGWFAPSRLNSGLSLGLASQGFVPYTGLYTLDGLLNGRLDVALDAFRHLVMPVVTLSLFHWATLGRITRSTIITERTKEYIISARARGVSESRIIWKHALRNVLAPSFTSLALSAASLVTGVFVVEIIFNYYGISSVMVSAMQQVPDTAAALGFSIYSVVIVLLLMLVLDVTLAIIDPRIRQEILRT
jgi:peptide/nickel transport system permease protein